VYVVRVVLHVLCCVCLCLCVHVCCARVCLRIGSKNSGTVVINRKGTSHPTVEENSKPFGVDYKALIMELFGYLNDMQYTRRTQLMYNETHHFHFKLTSRTFGALGVYAWCVGVMCCCVCIMCCCVRVM